MKFNAFSLRLAGVILAATLFTACKKDAADPKFMSWTLDGNNVTAAETNVSTNTTNSANLTIAGRVTKGNSYPQMVLIVPKRTGNSNDANYDVSGYYLPNSSTVYAVNSGNVTVTSYKATASLQALLAASPNTPPDPAQLQPLAAVWQQQLAQANWEDKKSPVNKKVANALLENLCATALLTENYPKLGEYAAQYVAKNKSLFGDGSLSFLTDMGYGGLARTPQATFSNLSLRKTNEPERVAVFYDELVADVQSSK